MNVASVAAYLVIALALASSIFAIYRLRRETLSCIFIFIVMLYVLVGPYLNSFTKTSLEINIYYLYQSLVLLLFYIPFCWFMILGASAKPKSRCGPAEYQSVKLSFVLPFILFLLLCYFWWTVIDQNLLFRRLGHAGLYEASAALPKGQLYLYRMVVESSFFIILALQSILVFCDPTTKFSRLYRIVSALFVISFIAYFIINSRMQLLIIFLMFWISRIPVEGSKKKSNLMSIVFWLLVVLIAVTLLRELVFEENGRLNVVGIISTLGSTIQMLAARVDILTIFYEIELTSSGYSPLSPNLTGYIQSLYFLVSFFVDPDHYAAVKQSLQTSSSVIVVSEITKTSGIVDFPKSIVVDAVLAFGGLGLIGLALSYSSIIRYIISRSSGARVFGLSWFFALFLIPIMLQFEKEVLGLLFALIKWSPMLVLFVLCKPRFKI